LEPLSRLTHLKKLWLVNCSGIRGPGLKSLAKLHIQLLFLDHCTALEKDQLPQSGDFKEVLSLGIPGLHFGDEQVEHIVQAFPQLLALDLDGTEITDTGLRRHSAVASPGTNKYRRLPH